MPQTQTSWNMLYGTMKAHLPAQVFHPGERFVRFEQDGDRITACFASGRIETGDLLVGADGARSTVREQVSAGLAPTYAGYVAWRGPFLKRHSRQAPRMFSREPLPSSKAPAT